ncbi:hypothetical protein HJG54_20135 [Leptolyngbya sp. NK1-12]|uniref:Uncharacterized protein n=1 Tax=Leptolyngbya sp. NK1-12 TaxID=2547451 RepID=A0AA97AJH8_9CYAN|nr:hypothetical protein [Leptolyngbya sp. NK1-12]WNZ24931.1 hypothetical protein HJG54_20135 [Leptolyngbya sp. NK1-12]
MNSLDQGSILDCQWQRYRQLELLPESVPNPYLENTFGLGWLWRGFVKALVDELIEEQQVDYLNRCWSLDEFGEAEASPPHSLQRLWKLMN